MIEVSCIGEICYFDSLKLLTEILSWISGEIIKDPDSILFLNGAFLVFNVDKKVASLLLLPSENSEKRIMQYLQQPPGEFAGKYVAKIPMEEPDPVVPPEGKKEDEGEMTESTILQDSPDDTLPP